MNLEPPLTVDVGVGHGYTGLLYSRPHHVPSHFPRALPGNIKIEYLPGSGNFPDKSLTGQCSVKIKSVKKKIII